MLYMDLACSKACTLHAAMHAAKHALAKVSTGFQLTCEVEWLLLWGFVASILAKLIIESVLNRLQLAGVIALHGSLQAGQALLEPAAKGLHCGEKRSRVSVPAFVEQSRAQ